MTDPAGERGGATTRERLRYVVPRAAGFALLVALPTAAALAWLSLTFDFGAAVQLGLLFVVLVVFRFLLRPYLAPLLTHPKDRAADGGEEREAD